MDIRNWATAENMINKTYIRKVTRLMKYSQFQFRLTAETFVCSNHIDLR